MVWTVILIWNVVGIIRTNRQIKALEVANAENNPVVLNALDRLNHTWGLTDDERALIERLKA